MLPEEEELMPHQQEIALCARLAQIEAAVDKRREALRARDSTGLQSLSGPHVFRRRPGANFRRDAAPACSAQG